MRVLGLDIGTKRIGLAISDELGVIARGLLTVERKEGEDIFERLKEVGCKEEVGEIVVGLPLNMDGSAGPKAKEATAFAETLKEKLKLPVKMWDERLTTVEAERLMIEGDTSRYKRKRKIDKLAAQLILQSYLNSKKAGNV